MIWLKNTKNLKYYLGSLVGCMVLLMSVVSAQGAADVQGGRCVHTVGEVIDFLYYLQGIAGWIWVLLGNLVGNLMTNNLVYGTGIGLDVFLWKIWQISRNIANFTLGFFFVYVILKFLLFPNAKDAKPKTLIKDMLISSVLIQTSWFIVLVLIDLSTILFTTVGAIPAQVVGQESITQHVLRLNLNSTTINANPDKNQPAQTTDNLLSKRRDYVVTYELGKFGETVLPIEIDKNNLETLTEPQFLDALMPSSSSLSGPLMYMGFSIFKTSSFIEKQAHRGINCVDGMFKQLLQLVVKSGMLVLYTIALLILAIILVGRLLYLWIFIAISPIAILLSFFLSKYASGTKKLTEGAFLNWDKIIRLIFQPVWFALYISLMMLVLVILSSVFQRPTVQHTAPSEMPFRLNQSPDRTSSTLEVADMLSVSLKTAQFTIGDALLSAIALVLMWKLVKLASSGSQIAWVDKATSGITSAVEQTVAYTPVIPTSRGAVGLAAVYNPVTGRSGFVDKMSENIHSKINRYKSDQEANVNERLGIKSAGLTSSEEFNLTTLMSKILVETSGFKTFNAFTTELKNILQGKQMKVSQLASYIHGAFQKAGAEQRTTSRNPFGWTNTALLKTVHDFTKNADVQEAWKKLSREHYSTLIGAMTGFTPKYTSYESGKDELIGAPNK